MTEDLARLRKERDEEPTPWKPIEPGDELGGRVVDITDVPIKRDSDVLVPAVTVLAEDGDRYIYRLTQTIARREFTDQHVQVGDVVLITYEGDTIPVPGRNAAKIIRVHVYRGEPDPDEEQQYWDSQADPGDEDAPPPDDDPTF
jgi:hypothetical protein